MTEKITKLSKENCKLVITTECESIKWTAWLEIHPKKIKYICDFTVDGNIVGTDVIQQYIGSEIVKKIQTQFEGYESELSCKSLFPDFGYHDVIHMTKLEYILNTGTKLGMFIGEVYDSRRDELRCEHTGGDYKGEE